MLDVGTPCTVLAIDILVTDRGRFVGGEEALTQFLSMKNARSTNGHFSLKKIVLKYCVVI
jgi:hypothetical protein